MRIPLREASRRAPLFGRLVMANRKYAPYGGSVLARLTLGVLDSGLEGAESAKPDETPRSIYDGPLATA